MDRYSSSAADSTSEKRSDSEPNDQLSSPVVSPTYHIDEFEGLIECDRLEVRKISTIHNSIGCMQIYAGFGVPAGKGQGEPALFLGTKHLKWT